MAQGRSTTPREVIIVGSGPAGYTAAIYAARAQLNPIVFEGIEYGGSLMTTTEVENYPGFTDPIMGPDLMEAMRGQAERLGVDLRPDNVTSVKLDGPIKTVATDEEELEARTVILAMGAQPRYLGIPGESELLGRGVSACATCDGFFFKGHDIAVVGGGDSAMEEALYLTRFAASVTIIHRRDTFRASAIMYERAKANEKIRFITNAVVTRVNGDDKVTGITLQDTVTGATSTLDVTAMFLAIGLVPRSELVAGEVDLDGTGHVIVKQPSTATSLAGVFAAGDLVDATYQQAITAAASGCRAAIDAEHYLMGI